MPFHAGTHFVQASALSSLSHPLCGMGSYFTPSRPGRPGMRSGSCLPGFWSLPLPRFNTFFWTLYFCGFLCPAFYTDLWACTHLHMKDAICCLQVCRPATADCLNTSKLVPLGWDFVQDRPQAPGLPKLELLPWLVLHKIPLGLYRETCHNPRYLSFTTLGFWACMKGLWTVSPWDFLFTMYGVLFLFVWFFMLTSSCCC